MTVSPLAETAGELLSWLNLEVGTMYSPHAPEAQTSDGRGRDVLTDFLGDAELKSIMSDGYNAYVFIGNELKSARFKDTVHQVCMSHAKNKFVKASNQGGEPTAERFSENFKGVLYEGSVKYDDAGLTPKERFQERQSLETKELLIRAAQFVR